MTRASGVVMDPDTYGAGAMITKDKAMLVMALSPSQVAACHISPTEPNSPDLVDFALGPKLSDVDGGEAPVAFYPGPVNLADGARSTLGGILPKRAARMELRFGNGVTVTPEVVNRTFALIIPDQVVVGGDNEIADAGKITVRLFGTSGGVSYEGPLTIWHPN
jgi:hypothetical protein